MDRKQIIRILGEIAILLEIKGENPFKVRAYQNGVRALETIEDFEQRMERGTLAEVGGLGKALCEKITILHLTGTDRSRGGFCPLPKCPKRRACRGRSDTCCARD